MWFLGKSLVHSVLISHSLNGNNYCSHLSVDVGFKGVNTYTTFSVDSACSNGIDVILVNNPFQVCLLHLNALPVIATAHPTLLHLLQAGFPDLAGGMEPFKDPFAFTCLFMVFVICRPESSSLLICKLPWAGRMSFPLFRLCSTEHDSPPTLGPLTLGLGGDYQHCQGEETQDSVGAQRVVDLGASLCSGPQVLLLCSEEAGLDDF